MHFSNLFHKHNGPRLDCCKGVRSGFILLTFWNAFEYIADVIIKQLSHKFYYIALETRGKYYRKPNQTFNFKWAWEESFLFEFEVFDMK